MSGVSGGVGWKVFTHDRRSPIQGDKPVWDGTYPFRLPAVAMDTSPDECAAGWNYCASLAEAFLVVGLWPDGRPSAAVVVKPSADAITRGKKCRASSLTLLRPATDDEVAGAIAELSTSFGEHAGYMIHEQLAWRAALARPRRDGAAVEQHLLAALRARGLDWQVREYPAARAARAARAAWAGWAAWDARADEPAARAAWAARDARAARAAWAAWDARADEPAARAAWAARDALSMAYASRRGVISTPADQLTVGLRDAYAEGLALAISTERNTLGYALVDGGMA